MAWRGAAPGFNSRSYNAHDITGAPTSAACKRQEGRPSTHSHPPGKRGVRLRSPTAAFASGVCFRPVTSDSFFFAHRSNRRLNSVRQQRQTRRGLPHPTERCRPKVAVVASMRQLCGHTNSGAGGFMARDWATTASQPPSIQCTNRRQPPRQPHSIDCIPSLSVKYFAKGVGES